MNTIAEDTADSGEADLRSNEPELRSNETQLEIVSPLMVVLAPVESQERDQPGIIFSRAGARAK